MGRLSQDSIGTHMEIFHRFSVYIPSRIIKLESDANLDDGDELGVGFTMSSKFIKNIKVLESMNRDPITVIFGTLGGSEYDGWAIYDAIKDSPCRISIRCYGQVMSMGTIILQAGDERILFPHTSVMFHDGMGFAGGNHYETANMANFDKQVGIRGDQVIFDRINEKRAKDNNAPLSRHKFKSMCIEGTYLHANEAVDMGLADRIEYPHDHPNTPE